MVISLTRTVMVNKRLLSICIRQFRNYTSKITALSFCTKFCRLQTCYTFQLAKLFMPRKNKDLFQSCPSSFSYIHKYTNSNFSQQNKTLKNIGFQDIYSLYSIFQESVCMNIFDILKLHMLGN